MIIFHHDSGSEFTLVEFELTEAIITPEALKSLTPPDPVTQNFAHLGVVLSGKGPIWLYGFLVHFYHPTKWVATFDPRLQGAVVVESHTPKVQVGDLITLKNESNE